MNGKVVGIFISPVPGGNMQEVLEVEAIAGAGLKGDRYTTSRGSFNKKSGSKWYAIPILGWILVWLFMRTKRQVTLISASAFEGSGFEYF